MAQFDSSPLSHVWKLFGAAALLALTVTCQSNDPCAGPGQQKLELAVSDSADFPTLKQYISDACIPCLRNTFRNSTMPSCERCPNGTTSYLGATTCKTCGPGRFISSSSDAVGFSSFDWRYYGWQQSPADCYPCPVGTYSNSSGSISCTPCPVGTYTDSPGSASCQPCPAGRYMKGVECLPCPAGSYNPFPGQTQCINCPFTYATFTSGKGGATACAVCPAGSYVNSKPGSDYNSCNSCPRNTYNDEPGLSGLTCKPCPVGFASPPGSTSFTNCTMCPSGSYILDNYDDRFDSKYLLCVPCPANTYNPEPGRTGSTAASCPACPRGSTSPAGSTNCTVCAAGSFIFDADRYDSRFMQCTTCPANTYNPSPGLQGSSCLPCPQGAVSQPGSVNASSCSPCSPGSYFDNAVGSQTRGTCVRCPAGSFTSAPGTVGGCTACPAGLTSRDGATSMEDCMACPRGTYHVPFPLPLATSPVSGQAPPGRCQPCPTNTYNNATGAVSCRACPPGHTAPAGSVSAAACTPCPAGKLVDASGSCSNCPQGTFSPAPKATACQACPLGSTTKAAGSTACEPCGDTEGGVQPADASKPPACATCSGGALMAAGAFTCPLGHGRQDGCELWQPCSPCPAGAYATTTSDMLWDVCRACPSGSFSNTSAATSCEPCELGSTTNSAGSTACVPCRAGTYGVAVTGTVGGAAAVTGATCVPCPPGTYSGTEGVVGRCTGCPSGRTHFLQGRTNASDCAVPLDTSGGGSSRTIRMREVVSWLDVATSVTDLAVLNVRNERATPGREVQVAVNGPAAEDVGSLVYETNTVTVVATSSSSPTVSVTPLSPPVPVGVTSYKLFQLAPGALPAAGPFAQQQQTGVTTYVLSVEYRDGAFATCTASTTQQPQPADGDTGGGGATGAAATAGVLQLVCKRTWKTYSGFDLDGNGGAGSTDETLTLTAL